MRGARSAVGLWALLGLLAGPGVAGAGSPEAEVEVFVQADCDACRQQLRALAVHKVRTRARPIDQDPAARAELLARLKGLGRALTPDQLPAIAVGPVTLPGDPPVARVLALLGRPSEWAPPGGPDRIQWFGPLGSVGPPCPAAEAALQAAGLIVERADAGDPVVAERMWVSLRLLGHPPRRGVRLPVWIVGARVLAGCPSVGVLAAALPRPAIVGRARAEIAADPEAFAEATLRALSTLRDRPQLALRRLLLEPGLLAPEAPLAGQLGLARRQPALGRHPWDESRGPVARIFDPLTAAGAAAQLLMTAPEAWDPHSRSAAARWSDSPDGPLLEVRWEQGPIREQRPATVGAPRLPPPGDPRLSGPR